MAAESERLSGRRRAVFYVIILPLLWGTVSLIHFQFPGDEYAMWGISSIAGSWIAFAGAIRNSSMPMIAVSVIATGMIVMAVVGFLMDWARVSRHLWAVLLGIAAPALCIAKISAYPSLQHAISKNGSIWAYAFASILIGIYLSVIVSFIVTGIRRAVRSRRKPAEIQSAK